MTRTIVFIHGAWVTGDCQDRLAPSWPGKKQPVLGLGAPGTPAP